MDDGSSYGHRDSDVMLLPIIALVVSVLVLVLQVAQKLGITESMD